MIIFDQNLKEMYRRSKFLNVGEDFDIWIADTSMDLVDTYNVGCGDKPYCYVFLINQWADQSNTEFFVPRRMNKKVEREVVTLAGTPPPSMDWKPYLGPVIDQGAFPTCWAHSVIVMAEALYYKRNPGKTRESFSYTSAVYDFGMDQG